MRKLKLFYNNNKELFTSTESNYSKFFYFFDIFNYYINYINYKIMRREKLIINKINTKISYRNYFSIRIILKLKNSL